MNLIPISNEWKSKADKLIEEKGVTETLLKFGKVQFTGAYSYNLMMHGDIDISVVRDTEFSIEEILDIFRMIYLQGNFRSYFIGGDWDDPRKGNEFPKGHYIGLKEKIDGERWKFDIWFLSTEEFAKRTTNEALLTISDEQRGLILECKQYRNENKISVTGQEIYDLVISSEIKTVDDLVEVFKVL